MTDSILEKKFFEESFGNSHLKDLEDEIDQSTSFENLCKKKLLTIKSSEDFVKCSKFIDTVDRIQRRYPFLYLPNFIEDYFGGIYSKQILQKYHLRNYLELQYLTEMILKLKGAREKNIDGKALELNLRNKQWKETHELISKFLPVFKNELLQILNQNILRAFVILYFFENPQKSTLKNIIKNFSDHVEQSTFVIRLFDDKKILDSFTKYLKNDLDYKISEATQILYNQDFLRKDFSGESSFFINPKFSNIKKTIFEIISDNPEGVFHDNFHRALLRNMPILKMAPKIGIWESVLKEMEKNEIIRITNFWRFSPYRDQLFTRENYQSIMTKMREQIIAAGKTKFFGRRINPDTFLDELVNLPKGDFNDPDDQVTRMAGLVLASSAILQTPHENLEIFDFAVDISNYELTEQQIDAMNAINFSIQGPIFHCKIMIHDKIDKFIVQNIRQVLPPGHQAVIFSFEPISPSVKSLLDADKKIQVIDKRGVAIWTSITPVIPCRVGSISKIMYGELRGKIVKINSINYESGLASVSDFNNSEYSVYIGTLEEIQFGLSSQKKYYDALERYDEFLTFLVRNSKDLESFEKGIFEPVKQAQYIVNQISDNNQTPKIFDVFLNEDFSPPPSPVFAPIVEWKINSNNIETSLRYVRSGNNVLSDDSSISKIKRMMQCGCLFFNEQTHSPKFCSHIISALHFISKKLDCFDESWTDNQINTMRNILIRFSQLQHYSLIEYAYGWLDEEHFELFIELLTSIWDMQNTIENSSIQNNMISLKNELIKKINSEEFTQSIDKIEKLLLTLSENDFFNHLRNIKTKHRAMIYRKKRNTV